MKAAEQTKVEYGDGVLRIEASPANRILGSSGSIEVTKNTDGAAAGLNIHATTAYGDITARSL